MLFSIALAVSVWIAALSCNDCRQADVRPADSTAAVQGDSAVVVLTGDILLDRGVRRVIERDGADALFSRGIDSVFRSAQAVVGNLECPATKVCMPVQKRYIFRGEPEWLEALRAHGITHLNLANNHSIDQGREGLMDTRQNIVRAGMVPVGADSTLSLAARPVLLLSSLRPVYLLASLRMALENWAYLPDQPTVSQEPMDSLVARIATLRQQDSTAVIIVSLHWGGEHTLRPVPSQRMEARRLIDAGADALVCHHTHTLQTIEHYRGRPIYYSLGNFIFDQQQPLNTRAALARLVITRDTVRDETIHVDIRRCVPYIINEK